MTALQYRDALKRLGLTNESAAKLLGVPEATSRRRAHGIAKVPPEAAALLRLLLALRLSPTEAMHSIASEERASA